MFCCRHYQYADELLALLAHPHVHVRGQVFVLVMRLVEHAAHNNPDADVGEAGRYSHSRDSANSAVPSLHAV